MIYGLGLWQCSPCWREQLVEEPLTMAVGDQTEKQDESGDQRILLRTHAS